MDVLDLGPEDAGEALTLQRAAYVTQAQLHRDPHLPPLTETLDELRAELADPGVIALGVREGDRLVGVVRVRRAADDAATAELGRLAVAPDRQGRGIGSLLLEVAEARVSAGVRWIRLFTGEHSGANLRLYERHGYRETHRVPVATHEQVFLVKDLRSEA